MLRLLARPACLTCLISAIAMLLLIVFTGTGPAPAARAQADQPILSYPELPPLPLVGSPAAPPDSSLDAQAAVAVSLAALLADWQVVDLPAALPDERGRWVAQDGQLLQDGVGPTGAVSMSETFLVSPEAIGDGGISTTFYDELTGTVGLVVRYGPSGFYRLRLHTDPTFDSEALVLEKVIGGVSIPLVVQAGEPLYQRRGWYRLRLAMQGEQLVATLNGQIIASVQDIAPLPAGGVGLYTRALGGVHFAAVTVDGG